MVEKETNEIKVQIKRMEKPHQRLTLWCPFGYLVGIQYDIMVLKQLTK